MFYRSNNDLPPKVKRALPADARDIYREAYNAAHDEYHHPESRYGIVGRDEVAQKLAWSTVKKNYYKDNEGKWHVRNN